MLGVAQVAGIMAAKKTAELIPLCHPLPLTSATLRFDWDRAQSRLLLEAEVRTTSKTGVEMEALTAVSVAGLTIYDMCKAVDRGMRLEHVRLVRKSGGRSGLYESRLTGPASGAESTPPLALSSASGAAIAQLPSEEVRATSMAAAEQHRWAKLIGIIFMPPLVAIGTLVVLSAYLVADPLVAARTVLVSVLFMAILPTAYIGLLIRRQRIRGGIELFFAKERLHPYLVSTFRLRHRHRGVDSPLCAGAHLGARPRLCALGRFDGQRLPNAGRSACTRPVAPSPATALLNVLGPTALPGILIVPLVCWARVRAAQHTIPQVAGGTLLGSLVAWLDFALILPRL